MASEGKKGASPEEIARLEADVAEQGAKVCATATATAAATALHSQTVLGTRYGSDGCQRSHQTPVLTRAAPLVCWRKCSHVLAAIWRTHAPTALRQTCIAHGRASPAAGLLLGFAHIMARPAYQTVAHFDILYHVPF